MRHKFTVWQKQSAAKGAEVTTFVKQKYLLREHIFPNPVALPQYCLRPHFYFVLFLGVLAKISEIHTAEKPKQTEELP